MVGSSFLTASNYQGVTNPKQTLNLIPSELIPHREPQQLHYHTHLDLERAPAALFLAPTRSRILIKINKIEILGYAYE